MGVCVVSKYNEAKCRTIKQTNSDEIRTEDKRIKKNPGEGEIFSTRPDRLGNHPTSYTMGTESFSRRYSGSGAEITETIELVTPLLPHVGFHSLLCGKLYFYLTLEMTSAIMVRDFTGVIQLQISFSSHLLLIIKLQFIFGPKMEDVTGD
jgi:hypothetical protein